MPTRPSRALGYHYVMDKNGKKHRVYDAVPSRPIHGKGGYYQSNFVKGMRKYVPKGAFGDMGAAVAGPLGRVGGEALAKIAGFGEYKVLKNSIIDEGNSPAAMHSTQSKATIRHREYIADVVSNATPGAFNNSSFPINPGLVNSLPWLAPIASQYEQYMIKGMVYEFKSMSSDTTVTAGSSFIGGVILATDYNPLNGGFVNKQQMENTQYTTSCKISQSAYHPIECDPKQIPTKQLYVRSGAVPANADQRLYDLGTFNVATFGIQSASTVLGELWCSYEIDLIKPVSVAAAGAAILSDHFLLRTVTDGDPLGTTSVLAAGSSLGGSIAANGNTYLFPASISQGRYLVSLHWTGTAAAVARPTVAITNGTQRQFWDEDSSNISYAPQNGVSSQSLNMEFIVDILQTQCFIALGAAGTLPASVVSADLFVTQLDVDIAN